MSLGGISKSKLLLGLAEIQTCRLLLFYVKDFMNHEQKGLLLNSYGSFDTELYCSHTQVSVFCICDPFSEVWWHLIKLVSLLQSPEVKEG